eukprot:jgi/Chrpa1/20679/Chrysochromulina_OHIO_Genome00025749-RA
MSPSPAKHKRKGPMKRTDTSGSKLSDADFEVWNAAVRDAAKEKADEEYAMRKAMHESGDTTKAIELVEKGTSGKVETEEWGKSQVSKKRPKKVDTPDHEERELAYGCEMREWGVPNPEPYRPAKKEPPSVHNWDM